MNISNLSKQQESIILSKSKKIIVLACPGSGKTTTLTNKMVKNIQDGVDMSRMLAVTFTRRATKEMLDKLSEQITINKKHKHNVCTIHSFGSKILFKYKEMVGLKEDYVIADIDEKHSVFKEIFPDEEKDKALFDNFLKFVSAKKNGFEIQFDNVTFTEKQFDTYNKLMIEKNFIDVDDLVFLPTLILKHNKFVKELISKQYDYIYVDEYQDINKMQNDFLDLCIDDHTNVLYVGDDDQCIYEFRGSNPNYILEKSQPNSGYDVYYLTTNYRSEKPIVDFSKKVLTTLKSSKRRTKEINANSDKESVKPIRHKPFNNKDEEILFIANEIKRLVSEGYCETKQIAVLSRYNSKPNLYGDISHPELKDIAALLRTYNIRTSFGLGKEENNEKNSKIKNLINTLISFKKEDINPNSCNFIIKNSYVKDRFESVVSDINKELNTNLDVSEDFSILMDKIIELNCKFKDNPSSQVRLDRISKAYLFLKEQSNLAHNATLPSDLILNISKFKLDNNLEFENNIDIYDYAYNFAKSCEDCFEKEEGVNEYDYVISQINAFLYSEIKLEENNAVHLLTAHQSKGLQFDVVFVVGLEAGNFPCAIDDLDNDEYLDNEKRLFYVCITRAKKLLYLTASGIVASQYKSDLADKSFIYNIPAKYFDDDVASFENIDFTYSDCEESNRIREQLEIIEQLKGKKFLLENKIDEDNKTIVSLNNDKALLKQKLAESGYKDEFIDKLLNQIEILKDQEKSRDSLLKSMEDEIIEHERIEKEYLNKIKQLNESSDTSKEVQKEKERYLKLYNNERILKQQSLDRYESLKKQYQNLLLKSEKQRQDLIKKDTDIASYKQQIIDFEKQCKKDANDQKNTNELLETHYQQILNLPDHLISSNIKNKIIAIFKRSDDHSSPFSKFKNHIVQGITNFIEMVRFTADYKGEDASAYLFQLYPSNFKGNLDVVIKKILIAASNAKCNKDYSIPAFLNTYLGLENSRCNDVKYFNKWHRKPEFDKTLANNMRYLYSLTTACNHPNQRNLKDIEIKYRQLNNEFATFNKEKKYKIFASFFEFIYLFINDNDLLAMI